MSVQCDTIVWDLPPATMCTSLATFELHATNITVTAG